MSFDFVRLDRGPGGLKVVTKLSVERKLYENRSWAGRKQAWVTAKDGQLFRGEKIGVGGAFAESFFVVEAFGQSPLSQG